MAWWDRFRRAPLPPPALPARVAAAQPLSGQWQKVSNRARHHDEDRLRFFAENLGLIRFANGLTSQTAARCELRVEKLVDVARRQWEPVDDDPIAAEALATYTGADSDSSADLVSRQMWHYETTGECMQIVDQDPNTGNLVWSIRSTRAVQFRGDRAIVMDLPGGSVRDGSARELPVENVRRLWVPDDEWVMRAKTPLRGVLSDMERYWALARRIRREAESALTAGVFFTPGYAHRDTRPPIAGNGRDISQLDLDYIAVAEMAASDDDSSAAFAPLPMHYDSPDPTRDPMAPKFIYPDRVLDPKGIDYRREAVEAIARGLDLPQSLVVEGPGGGNHWSGWLVDEKFFTTHLGPKMERVCWGDLTASFFRPVLASLANTGRWKGDPRMHRVGFDPGPVVVHPDRGAASIQLFGLGLLQAAVVLEANGFQANQQPTGDELAQILEMLRAVKGRQPDPIQVTTGPITDSPQTQGITGRSPTQGVGPATTTELPPAPALSALSPYPSEADAWID